MVEIRNLKKRYGERLVLNIPYLKIEDGESLVIIGPNGSGKSTLLKILSGIIKADEGEVKIDGKVLYLPQQSLPFNKSVRKNILYGLKGDKKENEEKCEGILKALSLDILGDKNAKGLSGGELQRLALGRVLSREGDCLVLDEPTSAADIEGAVLMEKALLDYKEKNNCTLIMTTHSPAQAKNIGDRVLMLHEGEIAEDGAPEELLENPHSRWGKKFISLWKI